MEEEREKERDAPGLSLERGIGSSDGLSPSFLAVPSS